MSLCLNCGADVSGKYCHECGQKVAINRLNSKALLSEVTHFITHIEHYFLGTTWEFIIRPGHNSLQYLKGKRKKYQKPVSFFLIWAGLYILIHNLVINYFHYQVSGIPAMLQTQQEKANDLLRHHFTLFFLPVLFLSSMIIYWVLAKPRFYYVEIFAICLYGAGCFNVMLIIVDLIGGVLFGININSSGIFIFQTLISGIYNFWFCYDFFKGVHTKNLWVRLILASLLISILGWVIFVYLPSAWIAFGG